MGWDDHPGYGGPKKYPWGCLLAVLAFLGSKPNQPIDLLPQIRFTASNHEIGGVDGPYVLAFGHPMGDDRALPAQEPTGCSPC